MERFLKEKIEQTLIQLSQRMLVKEVPLDGFAVKECGYKTSQNPPVADESWKSFLTDERWGKQPDSHYWFYKKLVTTEENMYFSVLTGLEGQWDATNPQFMVFLDGKLVQGLDVNHTEVLLKEKKEYELYLYAYSGMNGGCKEFIPSLKAYDSEMRKLYYDMKVPYDVCMLHEKEEKVYIDIMSYLENTANLLDFRHNNGALGKDSVRAALKYIESEFYEKFCGKEKCEAEVVCIGHTHIDVAWLWTLAQTREKVLRSFSTVINLMKQYPEYRFMSSQAQLYKYVKEQDPVLYGEIKEMVRQGRWEVEGAMWVEPDCNLTSGESLVRQLMFGKRFFKEEFGVDSEILWLPDVFGYSAALPQILKKAGVHRFFTSKISWNETNTMPNDTFLWQGIDGTEILTFFLTTQDKVKGGKPTNYTTYVGNLNPSQIQGSWERYQNKDISEEVIITYGYGDGGGGPTAEMIENGLRLSKGIPGCASTRFDSAASFFNKLEERVKEHPHVPKWVGELYLEFHRGTYTSMAKNKKYNRKSEFLYQTAELCAVTDMLLNGREYPQALLNDGWETILLNQFHDIIPGSSIKQVYIDSEEQYQRIGKAGEAVVKAALEHIASKVKAQKGLLVYNPLSFANSGIVEADGQKLYVENIPAKGYKVVYDYKTANSVKVEKQLLENRFFRVTFDGAEITGIYDKTHERELVKAGTYANALRAFEDYPKEYDNWEITSYYKDKMWEVNEAESIEAFDEGICAGLKIRKKFLDSTIEQKICLYDDIPRIDFDTCIDWKQDHVLLKTFFPMDVHAEKAAYDIQFGTVERPTHQNTSWDIAKFEVCAHKFADISEEGYGVSLLNDCKYGYSVLGNEMSLTLIKSGTYPNPDADKCEHHFVYSLYPHAGNHRQGGTIQQAYQLNVPMYAVKVEAQDGILPQEYSLISCSAENVMIDTVKKAEDSAAVVVRMYETYNRRVKAGIDFGFPVKKCYLADLNENKLEEVFVSDNRIELEIKPFEIVTLIIE